MISLTTEYALRAIMYLAQHIDACPIPVRTIAEETQIPRKYLSSILGDLVRVGILHSSPGPGGGFSMARPAEEVKLIDVFEPFEPSLAGRRACPFGNEECSDEDPCAGHEQWKNVQQTYSAFLEETSVHDVVFPSARRRKKISKKRKKR